MSEKELRQKFIGELQTCIKDLVVKFDEQGAFKTVPEYETKALMIEGLIGMARDRAIGPKFGRARKIC